MTRLINKLTATTGIALVALCAAGRISRADTVAYYTVMTLSNPFVATANWTVAVDGGAANTINFTGTGTLAGKTASLTLNGMGTSVTPWVARDYSAALPTALDFQPDGTLYQIALGYFTSTDTLLTSAAITFGTDFSIQIYQTTPDAGPTPGAFVGSMSGYIRKGTNNGTLMLTFDDPLVITIPDPATVYPPTIFYALPDYQQFVSPTSALLTNGLPGDAVKADIFAFAPSGETPPVPLPAVASMGMTMLGLTGMALLGHKAVRRRRLA